MNKIAYGFILVCIVLIINTLNAQNVFMVSGEYVPYADTAQVYLPKNYTKTKKFPAVFMLHGWSGDYQQWGKIIDLQHYADTYGMVIICPNGYYDSWYLDSPINPKMQFETFFFETFAPKAIQTYNLDANYLFITGLSMGGHGALYLFLKRPDFFRSAGSTSGGLSFIPKTARFGVANYLGEYDAEMWENYTVRGNLLNIKGKDKTFIFDCGEEDFFYARNVEIDELCKKHEIKAKFISQAGNHSRKYWKKSIKAHFDFFKKLLN